MKYVITIQDVPDELDPGEVTYDLAEMIADRFGDVPVTVESFGHTCLTYSSEE